ncbi:MAG: DUF4271 domain-containing protein [Chitinophagaceae bacterium]|nr:DUF4271 domain-containing protein [Chitinophagaceae bacterium]MCW5925983.1 DUF4271 domain-containing protein [Chitinophagaceae bacterium]
MKKIVLFVVLCFAVVWVNAQEDTGTVKTDTTIISIDTPKINLVIPLPDTALAAPQPPVRRPAAKPDSIKPIRPADSIRTVVASAADSLKNADSIAAVPVPAAPSRVYGEYVSAYISEHPYFDTAKEPLSMPSQLFDPPGKDMQFYLMCGLLIFLAVLRMGFPKYFQDLFNAFWRPAFRQLQTRDHLQEAGMTTLVFNIFFVFSTGLFACLVILYLRPGIDNLLLLYAFCVLSILLLYSGKYLIFKLTGWMFGRSEIAGTYMFIVFLINKVLAVLLIPFVLVLAFSDPHLQEIAFTISLILVIILFLYRYTLTFTGLRSELKISLLHLVLFVCGFEIIPVLLIYRSLMQLFERSS